MTAQILASELGNLIQDSKRKNTELRTAAEKALQDLKSLPVTSETQLTAGTWWQSCIRCMILIGHKTSRADHILYLLFSSLAVLAMPNLRPLALRVSKDLVCPEPCPGKG
jgi:hypothetical protein